MKFLQLLRPRQWTKNLFCFAGLIFSGRASDPYWLGQAFLAFASFCCAASCVYILNDIIDRTRDREHPLKRSRLVASGKISLSGALLLALVCFVAAILFGSVVGFGLVLVLLLYLAMNVAYGWWLKRFLILDVMVLSAGFILRIFAGTEAVDVYPTGWILLCTFFLALFLGFGKRRAELNALQERAVNTRAVLQDYSIVMLDRFSNISATLAVAAYALFTMSPAQDHTLIITIPPVVFALFRYLYLIERKEKGEAPEETLLEDLPIQAAVALWILLYASVIYLGLNLDLQ
jgi:4-hydroxybenzoate polyprenyltransferase